MHLSCLPYEPYALSISFLLSWSTDIIICIKLFYILCVCLMKL
jgi:hypothetical protein